MSEAAEPRDFLQVTRSATGRVWRDRLPQTALRDVRAIAEDTGVPEIVARIMAARGVAPAEADAFLMPRLRELMPDPRSLTDLEGAATRLVAAIERSETVGIFGDYDVDGATSSALMQRFLAALGVTTHVHIPDRIFEGYGPNEAAFAQLAGAGCTLVVTVDCGTASHDTFARAADMGLDVVVIDHHQTGETLPQAHALVNPNRQDDLSGQGHLAAVGVTFLVLVEAARQLREAGREELPDLIGMLDLVALGTVADIVPLTGLNRAYVAQGLKVLHQRRNAGLRALCDVARLRDAPTPYHLGFLLGPRINAGGRIGDAGLGARLLATDDADEAMTIATKLDELNRERQEIEKAAVEEAVAQVEGGDADWATAVIVTGEDWHPGIVGLIASRLKERFRKPAMAITFAGGGEAGTGSARSVSGIDLGQAVRRGVDDGVLIKGGGHAMAAGLTVARDKVGDLRAFLQGALAGEMAALPAEDVLKIDGALTAGAARTDLIEAIDRAGPYGAGHPEPIVALPAHRLTWCETTEQGHVRLGLAGPDDSKLQAIAFRAADGELGDFLTASRGASIHAAGTLRINRWGGRETVQLQMRDAAAVTPP